MKPIRFKPVETNPEAVYERTLHRIRHEEHRRQTGVSPVWKYVSIAASLALLALLSYQFLSPPPEAGSESVLSPPPLMLETSALPGAKTCVLLPDSSKVWLNSSATLRYPQQFTGDSRMVELEGEALFDIREDPSMPFAVSTGGMRIEVTGTLFNVYSGLCSNCTEVTLIEGSVSLYKDENLTATADRTLSANQQALYDRENGTICVAEVNASSFASWVTREFIFEKATMEEIARELERAFSVKIHITNDSIRRMQLNARFIHQETLDKILSILQIPANYTYRKKEGEIYIR
jgi:ferric-dicitrate binding protein FerR (iron transport regulator)